MFYKSEKVIEAVGYHTSTLTSKKLITEKLHHAEIAKCQGGTAC